MYKNGWAWCALLSFLVAPLGFAQQKTAETGTASQPAPTIRNGEHDFDFALGTWKTHIRHLVHPLTGSPQWVEMDGTVVTRKIWDGALLEEIEAGGPNNHLESLTVFLYSPQSHQWSLYFANSQDGALTIPSIGEFKNGQGEFYDQEKIKDRAVLVRITWSNITTNSHRFEQAFSKDGGKTWETNFIAIKTRKSRTVTPAGAQPSDTGNKAQHNFDWQLGNWKIHMSRLEHPLTGSTTWTPLDGTVSVQKVWNGRANLAVINTSGSSGHLRFLSLRLYNPQARQWSLNFASSGDGTFGVPMVGEFKNGRGEFVDQEPYRGKVILVRFAFDDITSSSGRDEQSFSDDGGRTWEVNWINHSARMKE